MRLNKSKLISGLLLVITLLGLALLAWPQEKEPLDIKLCFVESLWGKTKESLEFYPGETIYIKYTLTGYKTQPAGGTAKGSYNEYSLLPSIKITDKNNKEIISGGTGHHKEQPDYFKGVFSDSFQIILPPNIPSGDYNYLVTVQDLIAKTEVSQKGTFIYKTNRLFLVTNIRYSYDEEGNKEIPPQFALGDLVYTHFNVVGFQMADTLKGTGKLNFRVAEQILDEAGNELFNDPGAVVKAFNDIGQAESASAYVHFRCLKTGKFKLVLTVTLGKSDANLNTTGAVEFEVK